MSYWDDAPERFALTKTYHEVAEVIGWDAAIDFGMAVWEEKRPPSRLEHGGCGSIYIPAKLDERCGRDLVRLAGYENAILLVEAFCGMTLEFLNIVPASIGRRNRAIIEQFEQCRNTRLVACGFGLTDRHVRRIVSTLNKDTR
jgi:hypothetical protein